MATKKAGVKKVAQKSGTKKVTKTPRHQVQIGNARSTDQDVTVRVGADTAKKLSRMADGTGRIQISEADFMLTLQEARNSAQSSAADMAKIVFAPLEGVSGYIEKGEEIARTAIDEAKDIVYGDREKTYGEPGFNLETIARFWTTYVQRRFPEACDNPFAEDVILTKTDVAQMMILLKTARLINDAGHRDSLVDQIGYAALHDRIK